MEKLMESDIEIYQTHDNKFPICECVEIEIAYQVSLSFPDFLSIFSIHYIVTDDLLM